MSSFTIVTRASGAMAALLFGGSLALPLQAQTPDGQPPANEGVCDVLKAPGITPALYGLCVAYCEAIDAPPTPLDPIGNAPQWRVASPKLLTRYRALKKDSDPDMPCVKVECPCWAAAELQQVGRTLPAANHDVYLFSAVTPGFSLHELLEQTPVGPEGGTPTDWILAGVMTWDLPWLQSTQCQYQCTPLSIIRAQELTPAQAEACRRQIDAQRAALLASGVNVVCPPGWPCP